jgi:hypothetical protein
MSPVPTLAGLDARLQAEGDFLFLGERESSTVV